MPDSVLCPECFGCPQSDWEHHTPECEVGRRLKLDDRVTTIRRQIARLRVELAAVENGTLPWLEGRADAPDLARTPNALATDLGISRPGANNRLKALVNVGLASRRGVTLDGGGLVFCYSLVGSGEPS